MSSADHSLKRRRRRNLCLIMQCIPLLDDLVVLQGAVTYIQCFYDTVKDGKYSMDSLGAESPVPHDLTVFQQAISKLQHAYGAVALQTAATGALAQGQLTARLLLKSKQGK